MADWSRIETLPPERLEALFAADADRLKRLSLDVAGIHFDWSKTHLTPDAVAAFEEEDLAAFLCDSFNFVISSINIITTFQSKSVNHRIKTVVRKWRFVDVAALDLHYTSIECFLICFLN